MSVIMNKKLEPFAWVDWMIAERERQGMSQADLARKSSLTRTTISDYEKRIRPNPDMKALTRISNALGFEADYLPRLAGLLPPEPDEFSKRLQAAGWATADGTVLKPFRLEHQGHADDGEFYVQWTATLTEPGPFPP